MTCEEKATLARFLDLAGDYIRDGHARLRQQQIFKDDVQENKTALPLAYMIEEPEESEREHNDLEQLATEIAGCQACGLGETRTRAVPGEGAEAPLVMVIGEGPGADEDAAGRPFVGKAGQLLDRMLASIGLFRNKNCFIANMVKCRPPGNRDPQAHEIAACLPFLERQINLLKPQLILCLGRVASQNLLKTSMGINQLRASWGELRLAGGPQDSGETIPVLCTFHPSALLREESLKRPAWEDLKLLRAKLVSLDGEG